MSELPAFFEAYRLALAPLCQAYGVRRLEAFGSVLRPDFDPSGSDVDLIAEFDPAVAGEQLAQYFGFKNALEDLLQRRVDLVELQSVPDSRLKRLIAKSKVPIYDAAA